MTSFHFASFFGTKLKETHKICQSFRPTKRLCFSWSPSVKETMQKVEFSLFTMNRWFDRPTERYRPPTVTATESKLVITILFWPLLFDDVRLIQTISKLFICNNRHRHHHHQTHSNCSVKHVPQIIRYIKKKYFHDLFEEIKAILNTSSIYPLFEFWKEGMTVE